MLSADQKRELEKFVMVLPDCEKRDKEDETMDKALHASQYYEFRIKYMDLEREYREVWEDKTLSNEEKEKFRNGCLKRLDELDKEAEAYNEKYGMLSPRMELALYESSGACLRSLRLFSTMYLKLRNLLK